jgi:O-antigen/teichoic acid export membrane protein
MLGIIRNSFKKIGIDQAIAYTILARVLQAGGGAVSIIFIAKYLNKVEQGYFFTFNSIIAIQIFFELGLSNIITQFVAHEVANLKWISKTELEGSPEALSRLSSLLQFCVKWFAVISFVFIFILIAAGYFFFSAYGKGSNVNWQLPWIVLSVATACLLLVSPILAFFAGLGLVKEVAQIKLIQQIVNLLFLFVLLPLGGKLYASPLGSMMAFIVVPIWIFFSYKKKMLYFIWGKLKGWSVNYRTEIFPYQWRIALSWISGYFMYQLFNPVLFATDGPVVAGQMGISLAALSGILTVSLSWINTKVPQFSILIARENYNDLDSMFNRTLKQASVVCLMCLLFFIGVIAALKGHNINIGTRFLPILPLALLSVSTFVNQLVSAWATYLRCHKKEPFLLFSVVMAVLTAAATLGLGKFFGLMGIVYSYTFLTVFVSLAWAYIIFVRKKKEWHEHVVPAQVVVVESN